MFEKKRTLDENYQKHSCLIYSHVSRELFSLDFLIIPEFELDFLNLCVLLRDAGQHIIHCSCQQIVNSSSMLILENPSRQQT